MRDINFNSFGLNGWASKLKKNDKAKEAVEQVVQDAVEKAVKKAKKPEEIPSIIKNEIKLDTVEITFNKENTSVSDENIKLQESIKNKSEFVKQESMPKSNESGNINKTAKFGFLTAGGVNNDTVVKSAAQPNGPVNVVPADDIIPQTVNYNNLVDQWNSQYNIDDNNGIYRGNEPNVFEEKLALLNQIIDMAPDSEKEIWQSRRFVMIQNYTATLLEGYYNNLQNGSAAYTNAPFAYADLSLYGQSFGDILGTPIHPGEYTDIFPTYLSLADIYCNSYFGNINEHHVCDSQDVGAVISFRGDANLSGGRPYSLNEDPEKQYLFSKSMMALYKVELLAMRIRRKDPTIAGTPLESQLNNWIIMCQNELSYHAGVIRDYCGGVAQQDDFDWDGLKPAYPPISEQPGVDEIVPSGGPELREFYEALVEKYNNLCIEEFEFTQENSKSLFEQLILAAHRLRDTEAEARWTEILNNLPENNNNSDGIVADEMNAEITDVFRRLKDKRDVPADSEGFSGNINAAEDKRRNMAKIDKRGEGTFDSSATETVDEEYNVLLRNYEVLDENSDLKQDMLKILLNHICRLIMKSETSEQKLHWQNEYKQYIGIYESRWGTFFQEDGIRKPW